MSDTGWDPNWVSKPAQPAPSTPAPRLMGDMNDRRLYGDIPEPKEMFSPEVALRTDLMARETDAAIVEPTVTGRQAMHRGVAEMSRTTRLDPHTVVAKIYNPWLDARLADVRKVPAPTDAELASAHESTSRAMRAKYGDQYERLLTRTNQFIAKHPKLQAMLRARMVGSDPVVVEALLEHVRRNAL